VNPHRYLLRADGGGHLFGDLASPRADVVERVAG
jgi:hypothetical protein